MTADLTVTNRGPFPFLNLPFEIRQLIYSFAYEKHYIVLPFPQPCRYGDGDVPRPRQNVFFHPDAGNLHVYGINSSTLQWIVRHLPMPEFIAMRLDYDPPCGSRFIDDGDGSLSPFPLGLTCRQLHAELRSFIMAERATFAFADFRSLIIWLKRTDRALLARVRTVKLEMHLQVAEPAQGGGSGDNDGSGGEEDGVLEADEPWFDALKLATERLTGLRSFSMHAELCGPALQPTETFGPFRRIRRVSPELRGAFDSAARRVIAAARKLGSADGDDGGGGDGDERKGRQLEARHVVIQAVQRYSVEGPRAMGSAEWICRGRDCDLGSEIQEELSKLEILPEWQLQLINQPLSLSTREQRQPEHSVNT